MSHDQSLHGGLIGVAGSRARLQTPVLVIDRDRLDANIATMQALVAAHGVALRPHGKTHKSVDIARRQLAAGAVGLCCAKIGEAEAFADAGITGLLITSPVAAPGALQRLAALAGRSPGLMAVVDHPGVVARLDAELAAADARLDVLIDIDPGLHRTGVASIADALALAQAIAVAPTLTLRGVQFYCGMQQHVESYAARRDAIIERTTYLQTIVAALAAGHAVDIITGSGTGTHRIDLEIGVFTELQAGSYVFMDRQYLDCELTDDAVMPFATALFVDARVVSANHPGLVTIDAGIKSLSTDGGTPGVVAGAPVDSRFVFMGDEHGALVAPGIESRLGPGDAVTLSVPHCDPTVNLYDNFHVVEDGRLVAIWPVSARGRAR
jgi:D-serine deaminase-like pyridoxal phosphate-dependent protein